MFGNAFNRAPKPAVSEEKISAPTTDSAALELLTEKINEVIEKNPTFHAILTDEDIDIVRTVLVRSQEATGTPYTVENIEDFTEGLPEEIEAVFVKRLETKGLILPSDVA
jgi:hypothetical protein